MVLDDDGTTKGCLRSGWVSKVNGCHGLCEECLVASAKVIIAVFVGLNGHTELCWSLALLIDSIQYESCSCNRRSFVLEEVNRHYLTTLHIGFSR